MSNYTLNLPLRYRKNHILINRRVVSGVEKGMIPSFSEIKSWRSGNKISRFFRHIFEHKRINRVVGLNFAVATIASAFLPSVTPSVPPLIASASITIDLSNAPISIKTEKGVQNPLSSSVVNQGYFSYHPALDLKGAIGDPIKPIMVGEVIEANYSHIGYGNMVLIDHGGGYTSLYAHMSKIHVKKGESVNLATTIGEVGTTGHSTGPHLHLEVRENFRPINPVRILPKN